MEPLEAYPPPAHILPKTPVACALRSKPPALWSIAPNATVYEAIDLMAKVRVGVLLVLRDGALVGIVSERDYARKVILRGRSSKSTRVDEIMTPEVITVRLDTCLRECMRLMTTQRVRHLPVVERGAVVGVVSIGDIVRETLAQQRQMIDELVRYVSGEPLLVEPVPPEDDVAEWSTQDQRMSIEDSARLM